MQVSPSPFPLTQQIHHQQLGGPAPQPQQQQMAPPQQQQHQATQPQQPFYPSLHLYPLNDTFIPKQISLAPQLGRVKIGRQTNAKTVPGERNGYFDSKVLSRQHAEVWEEGGKVYIRDVKSSNGTFINGERLSQEGVESDPFELKTDDTVEFGIDIVGEDNKSIIHHKVAAKVAVVVTPEDAQALALHAPQPRRPPVGAGPANHMAGNAALGGLGGLGPRGTRTHGLTFDHILNRLQNELSKSRETGAELNQLTGVMTEIQDTLGGAGPPNLPTYPATLPPVRPHPTNEGLAPPPTATVPTANGSLSNIEVQLHETQSSLASHLDKIRQLEGVLAEHEAMKQDVTYIKDQIKEQMEERRREMDMLMMRQLTDESRSYHDGSRKEQCDDDEDARSVSTVMPDEDEEPIVDEIEEQQLLQQSGAGGLRPRTPEPHGLAYDEEDRQRQSSAPSEPSTSTASSSNLAAPSPAAVAPAPAFDLSELFTQNATLVSKLEALTSQLDSAMELSKTLQNQATLAQGTIALLEAKVGSLEAQVDEQKKIQSDLLEKQIEESAASSSKAAPPSVSETPAEPTIHLSKWEEWKETIHSAWTSERESWESEQKKLAVVIQECERRMKNLEEKEEDRRQREETESHQRRAPGFGESDSEEELDDGDQSPTEDVFGLEAPNGVKSIPKLPNGIHKKGADGKPRRKNRSGKPNGIANGLLPSPVASPTSSSSSYAAHRRGDSSPTRERERLQINGKLPLSPPNTSPRSRAESLPRDVDDESDLKESTPAPSDYVTDPSQSLGKFSKHTTQLTDLPMPYLSAAGMVVIGLAAYAVINRIKD